MEKVPSGVEGGLFTLMVCAKCGESFIGVWRKTKNRWRPLRVSIYCAVCLEELLLGRAKSEIVRLEVKVRGMME